MLTSLGLAVSFGAALALAAACSSGGGTGSSAAHATAADAAHASAAARSDATIVIGATLALTGSLDADGAPLAAGYRQEIAGVNAAGGIALGGAKEKLTLVVLDNGSNPATASAQARQLVQRDHALALLGYATPQLVLPVAVQAEELHVPFLTTLMPVEAFAAGDKTGWTYSWDLFYDEQQQAQTAARALAAVPSDKKIALFTDDEPDSAVEGPLYAAAFTADGLHVVGDYTVGVGTTNFAPSIAAAKAAGAQLLAWQLSPAEGAALSKQAKSSGLRPAASFQAIASDSGPGSSVASFARDTLSASYWSPSQASPGQLAAIAATLGKKYADADYATAALGYAVAQVLTDALERADSANVGKLNAAIGQSDARTVAGLITFSRLTHTATTPYSVSSERP
jgi:branched-chain amino acid transport system substrate-binding protein